MKIVSWNVNGIRSVCRKGFEEFLKGHNPDIICLQEIKAHKDDFPALKSSHYRILINSAQKKGYSGTAILSKTKPKKQSFKMGLKRFDNEGRFQQLDFDNFTLINVYLPHGGRQKENMEYKLTCYQKLRQYLMKFKNKRVILLGDFNVAHKEIDLARPKQNQNNTMFTFEEREQIDAIEKLGFLDTFRLQNQESGWYTWWPYMANARQRNLGWRIDYIFVNQILKPKLKKTQILAQVLGSDHCPVSLEINL